MDTFQASGRLMGEGKGLVFLLFLILFKRRSHGVRPDIISSFLFAYFLYHFFFNRRAGDEYCMDNKSPFVAHTSQLD